MIVVTLAAIMAGGWRLAATKVGVSGTVTYEGKPVSFVRVNFISNPAFDEAHLYEGHTDINGRFQLAVPVTPGRYNLGIATPDTREWIDHEVRERWRDVENHERRIWPTAMNQDIQIELASP